MLAVTPRQATVIEDKSEKLGVTKRELMLNAGAKLAGLIMECSDREKGAPPEETNVVFLAGSGNNGGGCA